MPVVDVVALLPGESCNRQLDLPTKVDLKLGIEKPHADLLANQPRWHRVGIRADLDRAP